MLGVKAGGLSVINWLTALRDGWKILSRASSDALYDVCPCIAPAVLWNNIYDQPDGGHILYSFTKVWMTYVSYAGSLLKVRDTHIAEAWYSA